jgi:hypothetical protein
LPDFYVLNVSDWKRLVKKIVSRRTDGAKINKENTVYWEPWDGSPKGWVGCAINLSHIGKFKDCWPSNEQP